MAAPLLYLLAWASLAGCASAGRRAIMRPGRSAALVYPGEPVPTPPSLRATNLHGLTDSSLWPAPISESHAASGDWVLLGSNTAAVGNDCPFLAHASATTLAACQTACGSDGSCNELNWNAKINDCVLRSCENPLAPVLTPTTGYDAWGILKQAYVVNAPAFSYVSVGFRNDVLDSAMRRYASIAFPYGVGPSPPLAGEAVLAGGLRVGGVVSGLIINVTTSDDALREGMDESYELLVAGDAASGQPSSLLTAATVWGALRGLESWAQCVQWNSSSGAYLVQHTMVVDAPRFAFRGVLVDLARHFIPLSQLMAIVDAMCAVKLNVIHLHLNDDQSFPLEIFSFPRLTSTGVFSNTSHIYRQKDMKAFVAYARERGVRVLAEFDSPAHFGTLQYAYPEYTVAAIDPSSNTSFNCLVDPSNPETFKFLSTVWGEVGTIFPDTTFMLGGDEYWPGCWSDSVKVVAWMKANGFADAYQAYFWYERQMIGIARAHGRKSLAWIDVEGFPMANETYNDYSDVTINIWTGCYSGDWQADTGRLTAANASVIVSGPYYITQQNGAPTTPHFTWRDMYTTDLSNFTGSTPATAALVHGGLLCAWDDAAETDASDLSMELTPYLLGVSEAWWSPRNLTSGVVPDGARAHVQRCRMIARGLSSHPIFGTPYQTSFCAQEAEAVLAPWERM